MPATLVWGKGFRIEHTELPSGQAHEEVFGNEGGQEPLSWSSVAELENLAEKYGASKALWPIYRDCEVEADIPLDDAVARSARLKTALESIPREVVDRDHWLSLVVRLLRDGNSFFIIP